MTALHLDWETKSGADLKEVGLHNYALHPTTDIWFGCYAFDDEPVEVWFPGQPCPPRVKAHIESGGTVKAHNALFEIEICERIAAPRYGWPVIKPEQADCTMARAYSMALPGALGAAAPAVGIEQQKDSAGTRLMLQMCRPREIKPDGTIVWWDAADKVARLVEYGKQDVEVERALDKRLMPLSSDERALWTIDARINRRGITIDTKAVTAAIAVVQAEQDRLNHEMRRVTGNFVGFCTETARLTKWVQSRGVAVEGIAKADVLDALADDGLPADVRDALLLRQEAGKSSTAKLRAMLSAVSSDGRLRGMFQYHGAGTGRWAGRRVQLQNLPRPKLPHDEVERFIDAMIGIPYMPAEKARWLDMAFGAPLDVISWSLRGMLTAAPGHELLAADFSNIEGVGLAWLAGDERKLDRFRKAFAGTGPGIYEATAADILGKDPAEVTKDERQVYGKVPELACGYQGGIGAFQKMAKTYLVKVADEVAERAKTGWRGGHPEIVRYWWALEQAALDAVLHPGQKFAAGPKGREVVFKVAGSFLWCLLPSGRCLAYPYPKVKPRETPWGELKDQVHYMTVDSTTNKWVETHSYGGAWAENITQAVCRDLLAEAIKRCEHAGYPVVLHVHDEVVSEIPSTMGDRTLEIFERICSETPQWAAGLPVVAKGWRGRRYRK